MTEEESSLDTPPPGQDPYLWLEDLDSSRVREWVEARTAETQAALCDAQFEQDRAAILKILDAPDRITSISRRGRFVYNFWRDAQTPKGLWRRTTLARYRARTPEWETVIDIDALARAETEDWVWRGCVSLPPDYRRCLVQLSRGGADAAVTREFDLVDKRFVVDGFTLPVAKGRAVWLDADQLLVSSALGGEDVQTTSGYARTVRLWRRGAPFERAPVLFECDRNEMGVTAWRSHDPVRPRTLFVRQVEFFRQRVFVTDERGAQRPIEVPDDAQTNLWPDWLFVELRSDWTTGGRTYPAGALLVTGFDQFMAGGRDFTVLFEPSARRSLAYVTDTRDVMAFKVLDNVRSYLYFARVVDGHWRVEPLPDFPALAVLDISALAIDESDCFPAEPEEDNAFVVSSNNSILPPTLSLVRHGEPPAKLDQEPARFDASGLAVTQHEAISVDGERIPYFQVGRAALAADGQNTVLLDGYGGFEISELPYYASAVGKLWLERGGVYVLANIRGGGEFGPAWHQAGIREKKKLAHDDFAAVAKDLIARRITQPARLACMGGSNGGLLVGNMLTRYPELFGAIECAVPLLDMRRYSKLLAGASWIAEYGDPDKPEDWAYMRAMSPYHCVERDRRYPPILLTSSGRDDWVHPGHARKMMAKLVENGHQAMFYEPSQGGHGGATDNAQLAQLVALRYAFLRKTIAPDLKPRA